MGGLLVVGSFLAPTIAVLAQEWEPAPPAIDQFDWIQLTSGEWLKGEIGVLYQDVLEFDSEELELLSLDLEDIQVIRSGQLLTLRVRSGQSVTGQLRLDGDVVNVQIGNEDQFTTTRADILTITAGVPAERNYWTGDIVVTGNFRAGNVEQVDTGINVRFQRRTVISRVTMNFRSDFTQTNDVQTVDYQSGLFSWDRYRSATVFLRPFFADYFSDPFQNIDARYTMGVGIGYQILDTSRTDWTVFTGPAYQETIYSDVVAGEDATERSWTLSGGTTFDISLTNRIDFLTDYRFNIAKDEAGGYSHRLTTTVEFDLTDSLDFNVTAEWSRTETPKPNADGTNPEKDDYRVSMGIGYEF
jgi:putative salt-induced outer membrane protein YdiY